MRVDIIWGEARLLLRTRDREPNEEITTSSGGLHSVE